MIDYSAPNVAKPMHVGHIRSTVIGAALDRTLRFLGHRVISDNHIGDWGTQFGMIIYGYKHFVDRAAYAQQPVAELSRLYRLVNRMVDYHQSLAALPEMKAKVARQTTLLAAEKAVPVPADPKAAKDAAKALKRAENQLRELQQALAELTKKLDAARGDAAFAPLAERHADIGRLVLTETAKLHAGDPENLQLWMEFLPPCLVEIERVYGRLGVTFDHTLGESFYHDALGPVVEDLLGQEHRPRERRGGVRVSRRL